MADLLSDFSFQKVGDFRIWIDRHLSERTFMDAIRDPDRLFERAGCQIIKDERKTKVGRVNLAIAGVSTGVYLKRYNAFSLAYQIASLFRVSRAVRSLAGATTLSRAGIATGRPLAAVELRRWALLRKSFFLSEEIRGETADGYWRERLKPLIGSRGFKRRRQFLANLAIMFRKLHDQRIYHDDLKDANILVKATGGEGEAFYLLDLEGVRRCCYLSRRRRVKNIVQLNRTLGRFLNKSEKLHLLRNYLGDVFDDDQEMRSWIGWILPMTERANRRSAAKHRLAVRSGTQARSPL